MSVEDRHIIESGNIQCEARPLVQQSCPWSFTSTLLASMLQKLEPAEGRGHPALTLSKFAGRWEEPPI